MNFEQALNTIRDASIVEVIGNYLSLERKGQNFEAICPFHSDSHPSLKVSDTKGIYKCFACGAAGDSLKFVMDFSGVEFREAVKEIGEKIGIQIEDSEKTIDPKSAHGYELNEEYTKWCFEFARNTDGQKFQQFLKDRNLSLEIANRFSLGLAPKDGGFAQTLKGNPGKLTIALDLGLCKKGNYGLYDTFRDKIIFPIHNQWGRVCGFGSRQIGENQGPKYINSSDSFLFSKKSVLYGLPLAKKAIRQSQKMYLAEGYMDVIAFHSAGIENVTGILGTALSFSHLNNLKRIDEVDIILAMDSDKAGDTAAEKALSLLLSQKNYPKRVDWLPHKDPDAFLQAQGSAEFLKRLNSSKPLIDLLLENEAKNCAGKDVQQRYQCLQRCFKIIEPVENPIFLGEYLARLKLLLGLSASLEEIKRDFFHSKSKTGHAAAVPKQKIAYPQKKPIKGAPKAEIPKSEKLLFLNALEFPTLIPLWRKSGLFKFLEHSGIREGLDRIEALFFEVDELEFKSCLKEGLAKDSLGDEVDRLIFGQYYQIGEKIENNEAQKDKMLEDYSRRVLSDWLKLKKAHTIKELGPGLGEQGLQKVQRIETLLRNLRDQTVVEELLKTGPSAIER